MQDDTLTFQFKDDKTLVNQYAIVTIQVTGCTNYEDYTLTVNLTVKAKDVPIVTPPTALSLTYNSQAQTLIDPATTTGGSLQYKLNDGNWSGDLPEAVDAGKYTVYYQVLGDKDYTDVAAASISASIAKAQVTITIANQAVLVGAAKPDFTYTVTGLYDGDTLSVEPTLSCEADMNQIGEYTIVADSADAGANYTIAYVSGKLVVSDKATPALTLVPSKSSLSGGGTISLTVQGLPDGVEATVTCDDTAIQPKKTGSTWSVSLPNRTATYTFTVNMPETDVYNHASATCTVAVQEYIVDSGSFDGGLSGGNYGGGISGTTNQTGTNDNTTSSTTTTTTNQDGSVTETSTTTDTSGSVGEVKTTIGTDGSTKVEANVTISNQAVAENDVVTIPIEVNTSDDADTATTITVTVPEAVEEVKIEIPVTDATAGTVVVLVHEDGTEEVVKTTVNTENGVQVTVSGNVTVKIVDNAKNFTDVHETYWGKEAIDFVSARELLGGVSETEYAPEVDMTRAMFVTVLARLDGQDTTYEGTGAWYDKGIDWAKDSGISDGTEPNAAITREQLVTMLYRYVGKPAVSGADVMSDFTDSDDVSAWAEEAMQWAVESGIINGMNDGTLKPQSMATRAQVAAILMKFISNIQP